MIRIMQNAVVIRGRLTGPRSVELDEPVDDLQREVEVIVRGKKSASLGGDAGLELLRRLPSGTRSREDIDRQIREERESWETH